jgi:CheY-like chemotaxis protein
LTVRTSLHEYDGEIEVRVIDTGPGISGENLPRIFEPFFSTKGEKGSGLGLSMTYSIVTRHGGDIRVDSAPGQGTTFTIGFPVATADAGAETPAGPARGRRTARILVVDDEPQVLAALSELLQSVGHTVSTASGGAAALEAYGPRRFDVVLTNLGMAGMNGWEFVERLRTVDRSVPVVFITGWGLRDEERSRLEALNVRRCLFKPVRPVELDAAVQDILSA